MAPKQQRQPAPDHLVEAVTDATAALAERTRLEDMRPTLATNLKAAIASRDDAAKAAKAAELEAVLAGEVPSPEMTAAAEVARQAHTVATNAVTRLEHALEVLPARLKQADDAILSAQLRLKPILQEARGAGQAEFEAEVREAVQGLAKLAARWKARTLALGGASAFLATLRVAGLTSQDVILSGNTVQTPDGQAVRLDDLWRSDPAAMELYARYAPATAAERNMATHATRIATERHMAEIEERNNRPSTPQKWNFGPSEPYVPPKSYGPLKSWGGGKENVVATPWIPADHGGARFPTETVAAAPPLAPPDVRKPFTPAPKEIGQPFAPTPHDAGWDRAAERTGIAGGA